MPSLRLNPLERVMGIQIDELIAQAKAKLESQSPRTGHGYSDKLIPMSAAELGIESQSPRTGHGYSDRNLKSHISRERSMLSQSPRTGHGYSDEEKGISRVTNGNGSLNPLERVMGIQI